MVSNPYEEISQGEEARAAWKDVPWFFRFGSNREIRRLEEVIHPDEHVILITPGTYGGGRGLVALTDSRIIFTFEGYTRSSSEDFPLDKIASIQWRSRFFRGRINVSSTGGDVEITKVYFNGKKMVNEARSRIQIAKRANEAKEQRRQQPSSTYTSTSPNNVNMTEIKDKIGRLQQLHAEGLISDEDFQRGKTAILNQI